MKLISHRGFSSRAPENTIASFEESINNNFKIIEFDVQLSKDNVPVIFHDTHLERTTNIQGNLKDFTLDELKRFDAGSWFNDTFSDEQIPTLDEVLTKYSNSVHFQIELKSNENHLAEIVLNSIKKAGWGKNYSKKPYSMPGFSLTSFHYKQVIMSKKLAPEFNVGWLIDSQSNTPKNILELLLDNNINMYIPNVNSDFWEKYNLKESLQENKITICAWGAQLLSDVEKMLKAGATAMTVNWPDKAIKFI